MIEIGPCIQNLINLKYFLKLWGMNSYLYAPKDDCKHRAYWREQYTVEEADHLQVFFEILGLVYLKSE